MSMFISPPPYSEAAIPQPPTLLHNNHILPLYSTDIYPIAMANDESATQGAATQGTATQGAATQGTATQGTATQGTATQGTVINGNWHELEFQRSMGWQNVCKFGICLAALAGVTFLVIKYATN